MSKNTAHVRLGLGLGLGLWINVVQGVDLQLAERDSNEFSVHIAIQAKTDCRRSFSYGNLLRHSAGSYCTNLRALRVWFDEECFPGIRGCHSINFTVGFKSRKGLLKII